MSGGRLRTALVVASIRGRDGDLCFYCGKVMRFPSDLKPARARRATIEHLIDRDRGGTRHHSNAVLAHDKCNSSRSQMKTVAEKVASRSPDAPPIAMAVRKMLADESAALSEMNRWRIRNGYQFQGDHPTPKGAEP